MEEDKVKNKQDFCPRCGYWWPGCVCGTGKFEFPKMGKGLKELERQVEAVKMLQVKLIEMITDIKLEDYEKRNDIDK